MRGVKPALREENRLKRALFLDRDGVINLDHGYVYKKEDVTFIDGVFTLAAAAKRAGYLIIVVTNQSGIGRGYYREADFHHLTGWMREQFAAHGAALDAVYFCPFHPEHGIGAYKRESEFRKPAPGMILQAATEHDLDLGQSILVGDSPADIEAGQTAGVGKLYLFGTVRAQAPALPLLRLEDLIPLL